MLSRLSLLALLGASVVLGSARPERRARTGPLVAWIAGLQETDGAARGAIAMSAAPSFTLDGEPYRHVVPYFANLAVASLLDAEPTTASVRVAEAWIHWFLDRVGPEGVPVEHWVGPGGAEQTCPAALATAPAVGRCEAIDATDSAASTFLIVLDATLRAGGDAAALARRADEIRAVADALLGLQLDDGLTVARAGWRVRYLMDNAETVAGLRAAARLERDVLGGDAGRFERAAERATRGLAALRDPATGLHAWARTDDGALQPSRLDRWYADAVAQVWPLVFGVTRDAGGYRQLDAAWSGDALPDWTVHRDASGFVWPVLAVAAVRAGDRAAARRQVDALWRSHVERATGPLTVADVGWLLRAVHELETEPG